MWYLQELHGHSPGFLSTLAKCSRTASLLLSRVVYNSVPALRPHGDLSLDCLQDHCLDVMESLSFGGRGKQSYGWGVSDVFAIFLPVATVTFIAAIVAGRGRRRSQPAQDQARPFSFH